MFFPSSSCAYGPLPCAWFFFSKGARCLVWRADENDSTGRDWCCNDETNTLQSTSSFNLFVKKTAATCTVGPLDQPSEQTRMEVKPCTPLERSKDDFRGM